MYKAGPTKVIAFIATLLFSSTVFAQEDLSLKELEAQVRKGSFEAQAELAHRYYKGDRVKQDLKKAAELFTELAKQEVAQAQLTLGLMYIKGEGVQKDDAKAVEWLEKAASQRLSTAQYLLGVAYEEGHGVKRNLVTAYMWYEIASALTHDYSEIAKKKLADQLSDKEITEAEQNASQWWLQHHH